MISQRRLRESNYPACIFRCTLTFKYLGSEIYRGNRAHNVTRASSTPGTSTVQKRGLGKGAFRSVICIFLPFFLCLVSSRLVFVALNSRRGYVTPKGVNETDFLTLLFCRSQTRDFELIAE